MQRRQSQLPKNLPHKYYVEHFGEEEAFPRIRKFLILVKLSLKAPGTLSKAKVTPMKKVNLEELLQLLIDGLAGTIDIQTSFIYKGSEQFIEDDLKLNIYRIIQEQLNNILKHTMAKNISVNVEASPHGIHVQVKDDGKGFEPHMKRKGIGVSNMINRVESFNGKIIIDSSPGNGCTVDIKILF